MSKRNKNLNYTIHWRPHINGLTGFFVALIISIWPELVSAQTVGTVICNAANQLHGNGNAQVTLANLFNGIAYISGAFFIGNGLYLLKEFSDSPQRMPLHQPLLRMIAGACLMSVPAMIGWVLTTLFITTSGGGMPACNPAAGSLAATDPSVWFTNFIANIKDPLTVLISLIAYTIGAFLVVRGFMKLAKHGTDPRAYSLPASISNIVVGALLWTIGNPESLIMNSLFGSGSAMTSTAASVATWKMITAFGPTNPQLVAVVTGAIQFFQVVGGIAFLRGLLILKNASEGSGQATLAQGFTHLIGGIMCLNMFYVLKAFDLTLGTNLL